MKRRRYVSLSQRERFPWLVFLLLVGSVWLLWFSPKHRHPKPVDVKFENK